MGWPAGDPLKGKDMKMELGIGATMFLLRQSFSSPAWAGANGGTNGKFGLSKANLLRAG